MHSSDLICLGVNHAKAPVELREKIAFSKQVLPDALKRAVESDDIHEAAILSTCNRIEIYAQGSLERGPHALENFLHGYHQIPSGLLTPHLYCLKGQDVLKQLMRVTASLDSLVLGEPQILGQVKEAYTQAIEHGAVGPRLTQAFSQAFLTAKRVRNETELGKNAVTIAYAAVQLAGKVFGNLTGLHGLLIGGGEMGSLAAEHFRNKGALVETAGRSSDLNAMLARADVVVASTNSNGYIVEPKMLSKVMRTRRYKPLFLIDISVPRNIDPEVAAIDNVYLYNIDDLSSVVAANIAERQQEAKRAEHIILEDVGSYERAQQERRLAPVIQKLQAQTLLILEQEIARAPEAGDALKRLASKLFHESVLALKESKSAPDTANL